MTGFALRRRRPAGRRGAATLLGLVVLLVAASCGDGSSPQEAADAQTPAADEHDDGHDHDDGEHDGSEPDDSHDEPDDGHDDNDPDDSHDHGDEALEIDHHGNPIRPDAFYGSVTVDGITLEFTMQSFLGIGGRGSEVSTEIVEGTASSIVLRATDAETGTPLPELGPAAWIDQVDATSGECRDDVTGYISGNAAHRPLVDFNTFFLLTMNDDPTLSVIDPNIDVGGMTNLYTAMILPGRGEDWGLAATDRLVVTVPEERKVAVGDTQIFAVLGNVDVPGVPVKVLSSPTAPIVWVTLEDGPRGGIAAIDTRSMELVGVVQTGSGPHDAVVVADGTVLVTNGADESLTAVDPGAMASIGTIELGSSPLTISTSHAGDVAAVSTTDGQVIVIDAEEGVITASTKVADGPTSSWVAPDGDRAITLDVDGDRAVVLDLPSGEVLAEVPTVATPVHLEFVESTVYVMGEDSAAVTAIDLAGLEELAEPESSQLEVGHLAPRVAGVTALASPLHSLDGGGLLVANPSDDMVYLHSGGGGGPVGSFQGHGLRPRAALALDRRLTETAPGVYTGRFRVPEAGDYRVAVHLSEQDITECFDFTADISGDEVELAPQVEVGLLEHELEAGVETTLWLRLEDASTGEGRDGVTDVGIQVVSTAGNWNLRPPLTATGSDGEYGFDLILPSAGLYQVLVRTPSQGLDDSNLALLNLTASDP